MILTTDYKRYKTETHKLLKNTFPWYLHPNPTTNKFFFMSHSLIKRHEKKINSGVFPFFEGETSEQVLRAMVELAPISDEPTRIQLHEQLQAREALSSTGLGHGIALPHPRTPSRNFASEPTVLLALLNKPVDWSAIDGQEVGAVFLLLNPDPQSHLRILSRISFLLRDENFIKSLKLDADPEQLLEMVALLEPDCA